MKKQLVSLFIIIFITLTGCSLKQPLTADEFRLAAPTAFLAKKESYVVNRPYKKVVKAFKKQAPKCLSARVKTVSSSSTSYQVVVTKYNPTVISNKNRTELHLQQLHEQGVLNVSEVPKKGYFLMVIDAIPASKNKTRIDYYGPSIGVDNITKAIKGWATGKNMGCPDLTK